MPRRQLSVQVPCGAVTCAGRRASVPSARTRRVSFLRRTKPLTGRATAEPEMTRLQGEAGFVESATGKGLLVLDGEGKASVNTRTLKCNEFQHVSK